MSLTFPPGPLSGKAPETVNYRIDGPAHQLFMQGFPRRVRATFGGLAVLLYFIAIQHINVGVATLLNYTAPIWSGMFSMFFIGEHFSTRVLIPLPIALAGIFLVVHAHAEPGDVLGFGRWEIVGALLLIAVVTTLNLLKERDVVEAPQRADVPVPAEVGT